MNKKVVLPLLVVALLPLIYLGCDSANPVAPGGTVLTVTANPTTIGLNSSSVITVTGFRPDGNPLNPGTQITLTTTLGNLASSTVSVGANGTAVTTLTGDGRSGTATVTASTPASESTATADVQIGESEETKPTLTLSVSPSTLNLNETATVSALARNADGSVFGSGGTIQLETTLGSLDEEILTTDEDGRAETTFRSGDQAGTAEITGIIGASDQAMADVTIENQIPSLTISVTPSTLGLNETAIVSVLARDDEGLVLSGASVQLETTLGTLDEEILTTDQDGRAETNFRSGNQVGTAEITGFIGSSDQATASVTIENQIPTLSINVSPNRINIEQDSTITVVARDINGGLLEGGQVRLRTSLGELADQDLVTSANGEARTTLRSTGRSGMAEITASVNSSEEVTAMVEILRTQVSIQISPNILDVEESAKITVLVRDTDNVVLREGHLVRLTANLGTIDPESGTTNGNGEIFADYTAGNRAGSATITAFLENSESGTATVDIRSAPVGLTLDASRAILTNNIDATVDLVATVRDGDGALLVNEVVAFSVKSSLENGVAFTFNPSSSVLTVTGGIAETSVSFTGSTLDVGEIITITAAARNNAIGTATIRVE